MIGLEVRIDAEDVTDALKKDKALYLRLYFRLLGLAMWTRQTLMDRTPVLTGETRDSWEIDHVNSSGLEGLEWVILNPKRDEIVGYLEYGTRPHVIVPVRAEALHWVGSDGRDRFAARVMHPGTRPLGLVRKTAEDLKEKLEDVAASLEAEIAGNWS